ncbi:MAG TPA: MFS transporter [Stellaceae bacterium]|nr:MFS transporter [Stellaceae bacterium]
MADARPIGAATAPAVRILGAKLDSIPFSPYHIVLILVLGFVGFVEGYDGALSGALLVLAKQPLHLTQTDIKWLVAAPTLFACLGGFIAAALSDHFSRKTILQIGVVTTTLFTLLIPLVRNAEQLIALRIITGVGLGFAATAPFPIAAELMPAQHRRTYAAIYEMSLASAFALLPFVGLLFAHKVNGFRLMALPGGLALFVVPAVLHLLLPESPRWLLRRGRPEAAVGIVNRVIRRCGNRVPPLTVAALGPDLSASLSRHKLPPFTAMFRRGQLRWTLVGIWSMLCAGTAFHLISVLLPKALVDQGAAVTTSFGISSLVFMATIPGKAFNAYLMEIIGRRWTIAFALAGSLPGLFLMTLAHRAGPYAPLVMSVGALITGFTVLSSFPAARMYLSEQFPTALRGRGHIFGESFGRLFAGVAAPFVMIPHTGSPTIFFGTIVVVVTLGAFTPLLFGKETIGQIETVAEEVPALA